MRKGILSLAVVGLAILAMNLPLHAYTASATNILPERSVILGDEDILSIRGDLERTIQFDVVPGETFTFDMTLVNTQNIENTSDVVLRLDMPNDMQRVFYDEEITLQGQEVYLESFAQLIPETELYGRYTIRLFIDNDLRDLIQFDLNSRDRIEVRWDDGTMANAWAWYNAGNRWAIRGCMPNGARIDEIGADVLSADDPYWPWPDGIHQQIRMQVWDATGSGGLPGTAVSDDLVTPDDEGIANPNVACPQPQFYVANEQTTAYPACEGQNVDGAMNHPDQMFAYIAESGGWQNYPGLGGDLMMWAIGSVGGQRFTIGTPPVE